MNTGIHPICPEDPRITGIYSMCREDPMNTGIHPICPEDPRITGIHSVSGRSKEYWDPCTLFVRRILGLLGFTLRVGRIL